MNETRDMIEKYFDLITFYISGVIQLKTFTTFFKGDSGEKLFFFYNGRDLSFITL